MSESSQFLHTIPPLVVIGGLVAVCIMGFAVAAISTVQYFRKPARKPSRAAQGSKQRTR